MNEADLNNVFKYDKIILSIDSESCLKTNTGKTSYYIDLLEPLRNVVYIKILSAVIDHSPALTGEYNMKRHDPIYICLNDYNRSKTYINSVNATTGNIKEYFDSVPYNLGGDFSTISYTQSSFDWTDPTVYILNPPEPNLRRLNIEIKDKLFNLFNTNLLTDFNLTICVYFMKNRV
jgi:hypothetical protein